MAASSSSPPPRELPFFLRRKLRTLQCPVKNAGVGDFQRLLLWLEEEKIRLMTPAERVKIRDLKGAGKNGWYRAAKEYLKELAVDARLVEKLSDRDAEAKLKVLDVLTSMAVHDEYLDAVEENRIQLPVVEETACGLKDPGQEGGGRARGESIADTLAAGVRTQKHTSVELLQLIPPLNMIFAQAGLPTLSDDVNDDDIGAAVSLLHSRFLPHATLPKPGSVDLTKVPIGVELEGGVGGGVDPSGSSSVGAKLHECVAILRFLHNKNMREFQGKINDTINKLQQYTADPRTDGALGRVGR